MGDAHPLYPIRPKVGYQEGPTPNRVPPQAVGDPKDLPALGMTVKKIPSLCRDYPFSHPHPRVILMGLLPAKLTFW